MNLSKLTATALCAFLALASPILPSTGPEILSVSSRDQTIDTVQDIDFWNVTKLEKRAKKKKDQQIHCEVSPWYRHKGFDTCITLTNATPYRWRKGFSHSYQMDRWARWPDFIEPGEAFTNAVRHKVGLYHKDTAAEVVYHLEGTDRPTSFMVEFRKGGKHKIWVRFLEELETANLPKGAEIDLGWHKRPDGQFFLLAGKEGDFISTNGPDGWMQSMMEDIGDVSLAEIVMGRSHHSGSYVSDVVRLAQTGTTQCQTKDISHQLREGGVRVMDMRLARWWDKAGKSLFYEVHGAMLGGWHGSRGATYDEIIEAINKFNDDVPGELIIFDVHAEAFVYKEYDYLKLKASDRADFYDFLKQKLKHRLELPETEDYTKLPVKDFIGDGKSAVIIRIDQSWIDKDGADSFPGAHEGFVTSANFPLISRWSDTDSIERLREDQLSNMRKHRQGPTDLKRKPRTFFDMQWLLTLQGLSNFAPQWSVVQLNRREAWVSLFHHAWSAFTVDQYPSWLTVDAVREGEFKSIVMAMNKCFVARACGDWTKKERPRKMER